MGCCKSKEKYNPLLEHIKITTFQVKREGSILTEKEECVILSNICGTRHFDIRQYNCLFEDKIIGEIVYIDVEKVRKVELGFRTIICCPIDLEKTYLEKIYKEKLFIYNWNKNKKK